MKNFLKFICIISICNFVHADNHENESVDSQENIEFQEAVEECELKANEMFPNESEDESWIKMYEECMGKKGY